MLLPSAFPGTGAAAVSISAGGELIGGWDNDGYTPAAWKRNPNDLSSYRQLTTSYANATDGVIAWMFWFVAVTADGRAVGADDYYVTASGMIEAGFWDLDTGAFITGLGAGTTIQDMMVVDGETVIAANGPDGGFLTTLDYPADRLRLIDLPGMDALGLTANPNFVHGGLAVDGHLIVTAQDADRNLVVGGWEVGGTVVNPHPWQNPVLSTDVDGQDGVTAVDVLTIINYLNSFGSRPVPSGAAGPPFFDVNGDDQVTPADVLAVINYINSRVRSVAVAEGEAPAATTVAPCRWPEYRSAAVATCSGRLQVAIHDTASVVSQVISGPRHRFAASGTHRLPSPLTADSIFAMIDMDGGLFDLSLGEPDDPLGDTVLSLLV